MFKRFVEWMIFKAHIGKYEEYDDSFYSRETWRTIGPLVFRHSECCMTEWDMWSVELDIGLGVIEWYCNAGIIEADHEDDVPEFVDELHQYIWWGRRTSSVVNWLHEKLGLVDEPEYDEPPF